MQTTAREIASLIHGTVEGDPDVVITGPAPIDDAGDGTITFLSDPRYEPHLYTTGASAVLVAEDFTPREPVRPVLIRVPDVYAAVAQLFDHFSSGRRLALHISPKASIDAQARLGDDVGIGPFAVVEKGVEIGSGTVIGAQVYVGEDVHIGKDCILYPGVKIYHGCRIGDRCIIHANAVIGSDGFGFAPLEDGSYKKIHQLGAVVIEDDVEVGANTTIDRGTVAPTIIRRGVKLDNLIQVAHNVEIGEHTVIAAQTGIAGSAKLGKNMQVGGQVAIIGHIHIADGVRIQGKSAVASSIRQADSAWWGNPAIPYRDFMRSFVLFKRLPQLDERVRKLEE